MQTITINLSLGEIIYDIQNKTYLTGKSRREGDNHEKVANMQANDDDENAAQILRSISMAYSLLRTRLGEFLELVDTSVSNEPFTSATELRLVLKMPSNYNPSTAPAIAEAAHRYIVGIAIADWFTITDKADAADYTKMAEESLATVTEAANRRKRPTRR